MLDIEAFAREAYGSSKLKVEAERKDTKESNKAKGYRVGSHFLSKEE